MEINHLTILFNDNDYDMMIKIFQINLHFCVRIMDSIAYFLVKIITKLRIVSS